MGILNKMIQSLFGNNKGNKVSNNINLEIDKVKNYIDTEPYDKYMVYKNSSELTNDFVVFDFETTGLDAKTEKIIQIGALRYRNNEKVDEFVTYVNPQKSIPSNITSLTGINNSDVKNAPIISQILPRFINFIGEDVLIAHNADFDMKFLLNNAFNLRIKKPQNEVIDTLSLSRKYIKGANGAKLENYKLTTLKAILDINVGSHNSADDCFVCAEVYKKCKEVKNSQKLKKENHIKVEVIEKQYKKVKIFKDPVDRNLQGIEFEKEGYIDNAIEFYELNIKEGFDGSHPYDRLAIIYRKRKQYTEEVRVLQRGIEVFSRLQKTSKRMDVNPKLNRFKERLLKAQELVNKKIN